MLTRFCYNSPDPARVNVSSSLTYLTSLGSHLGLLSSESMYLLQLLFIRQYGESATHYFMNSNEITVKQILGCTGSVSIATFEKMWK